MKLLVVEDDVRNLDYIRKGFQEMGHTVDCATTGAEAMVMAGDKSHDAIVLDRMLPDYDGLNLLKALRALGLETPVILLTAMGSLEDRVKGLESGADDYLVKPFSFAELNARVMSITRRTRQGSSSSVLEVRDVRIDLITREVRRGDVVIDLMPTEFKLLEFFLRHPGQVITKTMLLESVWGFHFDPKTNIVETHVSRLRSKIDKRFGEEFILTVRGAGYKIEP